MKIVDSLLKPIIEAGGSDLHIATGSQPMYRLHGKLEKTGLPETGHRQVKEIAFEILSDEEKRWLKTQSSLDFIYESAALGERFRSNAFFQKNGLSLVFRWIPSTIPSLTELGFSPAVKKITRFGQGIVLITGPSGCGKSTTLASLVDSINSERSLHIITIEDPIEFVHRNKNCLVIQRELGTHVDNFQTALKSALREDPDVIVIGDLRDLDAISLAITAAETGHLVLGTLNTNNAVQTIDRIIDSYPPEQQPQIRVMFAESLRAIISQQLLPRTDEQGLVCAYELLLANSGISNLIRDNKQHQIVTVMQTNRKQGMQLMDVYLKELIDRGLITAQDALERASDPGRLQEAVTQSAGTRTRGAISL